MNRNLIKLFFFLSITLICVFITGLKFTEQFPSSDTPPEYILREYNGKTAVFEKGRELPVFIEDIFIDNLPEKDRKALREGIILSSPEELQSLIEDFSS